MPAVMIEGKTVQVDKDATVLEAARKAHVWIPTLCHSPVVAALGTCRLCIVEVESAGRRRLVTACNYPVRQDMTVRVAGGRAESTRRGVMQLLLARSPESPELAVLAARMGVKGTPYPKVTESLRNCVLCGLCVAVCDEVIGASAIGFAGRGVERSVCGPFRLAAEDCIACGACAAICPVGTIQIRIHDQEGEAEISPFKARVKLLVCEECGRRMVSQPVGENTFNKVNFQWEEFRTRARLCPECRRKNAAGALAMVAAKSSHPGAETKNKATLEERS